MYWHTHSFSWDNNSASFLLRPHRRTHDLFALFSKTLSGMTEYLLQEKFSLFPANHLLLSPLYRYTICTIHKPFLRVSLSMSAVLSSHLGTLPCHSESVSAPPELGAASTIYSLPLSSLTSSYWFPKLSCRLPSDAPSYVSFRFHLLYKMEFTCVHLPAVSYIPLCSSLLLKFNTTFSILSLKALLPSASSSPLLPSLTCLLNSLSPCRHSVLLHPTYSRIPLLLLHNRPVLSTCVHCAV